MTTTQYLSALKKLGLNISGKKTAAALGLSPRQLRRIASGDSKVPPPVDRLLTLLLKIKSADK